MPLLWLNFELDAGGFPEWAAVELVALADRLHANVKLRANGGAEMFAMPGEDPLDVLARWQRTDATRRQHRPNG